MAKTPSFASDPRKTARKAAIVPAEKPAPSFRRPPPVILSKRAISAHIVPLECRGLCNNINVQQSISAISESAF